MELPKVDTSKKAVPDQPKPPAQAQVRNEAIEELRLTNQLLNSLHSWITFAITIYLLNMALRFLIFVGEMIRNG